MTLRWVWRVPILLLALTSCGVKKNQVSAPPPPRVAGAPQQMQTETAEVVHEPQPASGADQLQKTIEAVRAQAAAVQFRPSLADYVPCRFREDYAARFRQGETDIGAGAAPADAKSALLAMAEQGNAGIRDRQKFEELVNSSTDPWTAIVEARKQGVLTDQGATDAAKAAAAAANAATPLDVGCSEGVLTWNETRVIFGRAVADNYVAIQVTARNLNGDQEFLIHDLQVAVAEFAASSGKGVNEGKSGRGYEPCPIDRVNPNENSPNYVRFVAGRDRMMVRGVGEVGAQLTPRNIAVRVLDVVGSILGGTAAVTGGPSFSDAVHVFSSTFIPGFGKIFPDFTVDQLNRLNDLGFSAASAYKIVIPKNGSVPMTTFLPGDIFAKNYRYWSHCDLLNFEQNMVVVLGGKHIQEAGSTQPGVATVSCPKTASGDYLDYTKANGDSFECTVTGQNLQNVTALRLKNATDAKDTKTIDGAVSVSGKTDAGTVRFSLKQLQGLAGTQYQIYVEASSGGEQSTSTKFDLPPALADVRTDKDCIAGATCTVTLTGSHLDTATELDLMQAATATTPDFKVALSGSKPDSTSVVLDLTAGASKVKTNSDYVLFLKTKDGDVNTGKTLTVKPAPKQ